MDRNCNKCIHHTSGSCSVWECKGTVTVEDVRKNAIEEHFRKIMSFIDTDNRGNCDYFIVDQIENYIAEQLKEIKNE